MPLNPAGETPDTGVPPALAAEMTMSEQYDWHRSFLRRHPVSRRNFLRGSAAAAASAGLATLPWGGAAFADPADVTVGGRHLAWGSDPATQLRFSAQVSASPAGGAIFLDHGPTLELGSSQLAEVRNLVSQVPTLDGGILGAEQFYVHAGVNGLTPNTEHFYRWRTAGGFASDIRSTRTAPAPGAPAPFRFTMMGDQGVDETPAAPAGLVPGDYDNLYYKADNAPTVKHTQNVNRQIALANPAFHILAGDIAYADPSGMGKPGQFVPSGQKNADGFDKFNPYVWDAYFHAIEESSSRSPWMFATGNHDMEALYGDHGYGGHTHRLYLPGDGPAGCPSVYAFRYGNVAVLSLDANDVSAEIKANTGYSGGIQTGWLEDKLAGFRADPTIDFIVAFFHHCAYSTTEAHASDGGVRSLWTPLFDKYRVDIVLQGHNHVFERTDAIRDGKVRTPAPDQSVIFPETDGTVYYTVGGGGRPRYTSNPTRARHIAARRVRHSSPTAMSGTPPAARRSTRRPPGHGSVSATTRSWPSM